MEGKEAHVAREAEISYRELFLDNPLAMWVCQRETGSILTVNEAALRLYGYRREEFTALSAMQLLDAGETLPKLTGDLTVTSRQRRADGSLVEVIVSWHPVSWQKEPALMALVREPSHDEAELQRLLQEQKARVADAQRELETFSYSISHDLQAPLRHINGFSQALLDDYTAALDEQGQEYLGRISQAAEKMSRLIAAIQQLSRVSRAELSRQQVSLSVAAQVISLELKHDAPERRAEFQIEEGVSVEADPRLVRQLLEILIGNAWKFSSKQEETRITFGSREIDGERVFVVSDNGVGFDMSYAQKLFSIFHRLHREEEFEGVGVGLAIAQRIVSRHGGRIWAESAPGQGATFYFTL
jgi:PAS domain S-box-containing protein